MPQTPRPPHPLRARLARSIAAWIAREGLTQHEAAELFGLRQYDVSRILVNAGQLCSMERLLQAFERIGGSVILRVNPVRSPRGRARKRP